MLGAKMRNSDTDSKRANWLAYGVAAVLCLATLLYVFPPTSGRAFTKSGLPPATGLVGGSAWIPGRDTLLW
jgi:hypothetical protein